jgi:branched-chain amino acid transport system permease protein
MRVVNMAHGSLYLLGGYLAFEIQEGWFQKETEGLNLSLASPGGGAGEYDLVGWLVPLVLSVLLIGLLGVVLQQVFLRWNQGQDLRQALITIAISVIMADQMLAEFGGIAKDIKTPSSWPESVTVFGVQYGFFRLVIVTGAAIAIGWTTATWSPRSASTSRWSSPPPSSWARCSRGSAAYSVAR